MKKEVVRWGRVLKIDWFTGTLVLYDWEAERVHTRLEIKDGQVTDEQIRDPEQIRSGMPVLLIVFIVLMDLTTLAAVVAILVVATIRSKDRGG